MKYPKEVRLVEWESGGRLISVFDPQCPARSMDKIIYNTGDIVYKKNGSVVGIIPHDTNARWKMVDWVKQGESYIPMPCDAVDTKSIDAYQFPHPTREAIKHENMNLVIANLAKDSHHYDALIAYHMKCAIKDIDGDTVARFFNLPEPSRDIKIKMSRAGAQCFSVSIHVSLNPALQDNVMEQLDILLANNKEEEWLDNVWGWNVGYEAGVSSRSFSGSAKEAHILLQRWVRNCENKFGRKNITTESSL